LLYLYLIVCICVSCTYGRGFDSRHLHQFNFLKIWGCSGFDRVIRT